jgi:hypothetical protein
MEGDGWLFYGTNTWVMKREIHRRLFGNQFQLGGKTLEILFRVQENA